MIRIPLTAVLALALTANALGASPKARATSPGIVVEDVAKGSDADVAGIKAGDVLMSWERAPNPPANPNGAEGNFRDVTDFLLVFWEQSPRGPFTLLGLRDTTPISFRPLSGHWEASSRPWMLEGSFTLLSDSWGISARPPMAPDLLTQYEKGKTLRRAGQPQAAASLWVEIASKIETTQPRLARWLYTRAADTFSDAKAWQLADQALGHAAALAQHKRDLAVLGEIWYRRGWSQRRRHDWDAAEAAYKEAGALWNRAFGQSLTLAMVKATLAYVAREQNEWGDALLVEVMTLRQKQAPESMPLAISLGALGSVQMGKGNLIAAESLYQRSLEMARRLSPDGLNVATVLNSLGALANARGDLALAEKLGGEALDIQRRHSPGTPVLASTLHNLGNVAFERGDIGLAEQRIREALEIRHRVIPGGDGEALSLGNLGSIAWFRGDLEMAEKRYLAGC